jgi:hypothetical protein
MLFNKAIMKILRNIRQKLASENKVMAYLRYAIGEILLVVIGILIALQINNWNSQRIEEDKTGLLIEQVYSAIKQDNDNLASDIIFYTDQLHDCDILLNTPNSLTDQQLLEMLFYVNAQSKALFEADKFAEELNFDNIARKHVHLVAQIKNFVNANVYKMSLSGNTLEDDKISKILLKNNITEIVSTFGYSSYFNFHQYNGSFTKDDFSKVRQLIKLQAFRSPLESVKIKLASRIESSTNIIADGKYLVSEIKNEFPNLRLMYDNVGIIGSSLPTAYTKSVPMILVDEHKSIWEINLKLSEGNVKFRTRDSWTQNWGGTTFPRGSLQYFGRDIHILEPGFYHIKLNLNDNTYKFELIKK